MKTKAFIIAFLLLLAFLMAEPEKLATFEIRAVMKEGGKDTEEMIYSAIHPSGEKLDAEPLHVQKTALIDQMAIRTATAIDDPVMGHVVQVSFTEEGTKRFAEITRAHVWKRLAVLIDGKVRSAPTPVEAITTGKAMVSGFGGKEEAEELAARLRATAQKNAAAKP